LAAPVATDQRQPGEANQAEPHGRAAAVLAKCSYSFGGKFVWGTGAGNGPWFIGDFEGGVWAGGSGIATTQNGNNPSVTWDYAFGLVKTDTANGTPQCARGVGDVQSGGLTTAYDGKAPAPWNLQGGIVLGGDNSNSSYGTFLKAPLRPAGHRMPPTWPS
jgi:hypothetical protein